MRRGVYSVVCGDAATLSPCSVCNLKPTARKTNPSRNRWFVQMTDWFWHAGMLAHQTVSKSFIKQISGENIIKGCQRVVALRKSAIIRALDECVWNIQCMYGKRHGRNYLSVPHTTKAPQREKDFFGTPMGPSSSHKLSTKRDRK